MKKGLIVFYTILIFAFGLLFLGSKIPAVQETFVSITEDDFTEDNIYEDLESLSGRLDQEILKGTEEITVFLKDVNPNEIDKINKLLDGIYGRGSSYQIMGAYGDTYTKVRITIEKTANYYAVDAYLNGSPIPEDQPKAKELYQAITTIMRANIKEGMSDYEKELALHDYLVKNCHYSEDTDVPEESDIYRGYGALVNKVAVCNGYAEAMQMLFRCVNIESRFVIGTAKNNSGEWISHAWNLVLLDGNWYHLDTTWDDPTPDQGDKILHPYFNVGDDVILANHKWEQKRYPQATSIDYNYYHLNVAEFKELNEYQKAAYEAIIYGTQTRYEGVIENYEENEESMQFIFEGNDKYNSVSWHTYPYGTGTVLVMDVEK